MRVGLNSRELRVVLEKLQLWSQQNADRSAGVGVCGPGIADGGEPVTLSPRDGRAPQQGDRVEAEATQSDPHFAPSGEIRALSRAAIPWSCSPNGQGQRRREATHGQAEADAQALARRGLNR